MLKNLWKSFKEGITGMNEIKTIEEAIGKDIEITDQMIDKINLWRRLYENKPPWKIKRWTDDRGVLQERELYTLNLPSSIASEVARLVTLEMESNITGSNTEEINELYQKQILDGIKIRTEYAVALGGIIFKPYIFNGKLATTFYYADEFIPVRFSTNGELLEVVLIDIVYQNDKKYTKLEYHEQKENAVIIRQYLYESNKHSDNLGTPVELSAVDRWADLEGEIIIENRDKPVFSYFKMPLANQVDMDSYVGVSIYSKAIDHIKQADMLWNETDSEYIRSSKKVFASDELFKRDEQGNITGEIPDEIVVLHPEGGKEDFVYKEYVPQIRNKEYHEGLENIKRTIEFNCGLAYGTLSELEEVAKTATEIKASRQRSYTTIADIQKALEESLLEVVDIMVFYYNQLYNNKVGEYEVSFDFDDSLVVDNEQEQRTYLLEVQAGIRSIESYLKAIYDMTDKEVAETIPGGDELLEGKDTDDFE